MGEYIPIRNLKPGMKDLTLMFIVLDVSTLQKWLLLTHQATGD